MRNMSRLTINAKQLRSFAIVLALGLAGCAGIQQPHRAHLDSADSALRECAHWFRALDAAVARTGVADIGARRVAGFPYLRVDRFGAALRDNALADLRVGRAWVEHLRALGADGRRIEIANLPQREVERLGAADHAALTARLQDCTPRLLAVDLPDDRPDPMLARRAYVADDYSSAKRALGVYELTRLPFYAGVEGWEQSATRTFAAARRGSTPRGPLVRYLPRETPVYTRPEVRALLTRAARHALGRAQLSADEWERLFATYAPILEIETSGDFDRIGRLHWTGAAAPQVDISRPTVYRRLDHTRIGNQTLLQLVYVAWLPERPREHAFDLLGGHLDGIVWRVTLAPDGEPLLYDSIHPCGCYHMFFPTPRVAPIAAPQNILEWAFAPATLPRIAPHQRLVLGLQTRTHYLRNVWPGNLADGTHYQFADYDALRSLTLPEGGSRSIFGPDGLVPGTERRERFLFWPMGIANAGAMRQAGTHATAFVGRRHFDDADLIEKRFRLLE